MVSLTGEQIYNQILEIRRLEIETVDELKRLRKHCMDDQETNWEAGIEKDLRHPVQVLYKELVDNIRKPLKEAMERYYVMDKQSAPRRVSNDDLSTIIAYCRRLARLVSPTDARTDGLNGFDSAVCDFLNDFAEQGLTMNIGNDTLYTQVFQRMKEDLGWDPDKEIVDVKGFPPRMSYADFPMNPRQG